MQHLPSETFALSNASPASGAENPALQHSIEREAVRLLVDRESMAMVSTLLACMMVLLASIEMGVFSEILPLISIRIAASLLNSLVMRRTLDNIRNDVSYSRNFEAVTWGVAAGGMIWASMLGPVFGLLDDTPTAILVLLCVLAAGGLTVLTTSLVPRTMRIFLCSHFLGIFAVMAIHYNEFGWVGFVALAVYGFTLYRFGQKEFQQSSRSIRLQIENEELAQKLGEVNARLNVTLATARKLSAEDALTGLYNRRAFEEKLFRLRDNGLRDKPVGRSSAIALLLLDLDYFKTINDQFGHLVGDAVLTACADAIRIHTGEAGVAGRWGGEEFIVALPRCDVAQAEASAEALRAAIEGLADSNWPDGLKISASIGLAWWQEHETLEAALGRADKALYRAKKDGRNRVHAAALTGTKSA